MGGRVYDHYGSVELWRVVRDKDVPLQAESTDQVRPPVGLCLISPHQQATLGNKSQGFRIIDIVEGHCQRDNAWTSWDTLEQRSV